MPKNIIICSDGTGNTAIKNRGTNVFKLFEAVDLNGHRFNPSLDAQVALYDDGVGTERFVPIKLLAGAFGFGLARNVRKLYTELVRVYDPEDRIYLFGFSRGAFTARTLAGMIGKCGVLDREKLPTSDDLYNAVRKTYKAYRRSYRTWIQASFQRMFRALGRKSDRDALEAFRREHSLDYDVRIKFIGVWDTVDAVGGPFHTSDVINAFIHRFKFPDHKLSDKVDCACHALAVDEARAAFQPVLWEADNRIEQVWFAGVHSNVGGGYTKQGMSLVALDWMLRAAHGRGLRILESDSEYYREHANVDDKLYDSRAGLGVFYRWKPRDMQRLCELHGAGLPVIHLSLLERIAHGTDGYNPGTLSHRVSVTFTRSDKRDLAIAEQEDSAADLRATAVQAALEQAYVERAGHLGKTRLTPLLGSLSYYLYVLSCLGIVLALLPQHGNWMKPLLLLAPWIMALPVGGFALSIALAGYVDNLRSKTFSSFWHMSRQELRLALKGAKKSMGAAGGK